MGKKEGKEKTEKKREKDGNPLAIPTVADISNETKKRGRNIRIRNSGCGKKSTSWYYINPCMMPTFV